MNTPTPRWTAETEELLHRTLHDLDVRINNLTGDHHCNLVTQVALTTLADAGVLTAVGGETRQEWRAVSPDGLGMTWTTRPKAEWVDAIRGMFPGTRIEVGHWREVTDADTA